jgi:hypothetical protein
MRKVTLSLVWVTSFDQQEKTKSSSNTNIQQKLRVLLLDDLFGVIINYDSYSGR